MKKMVPGLLFLIFCIIGLPSRTDAQVTLYTDVVHYNWGGPDEPDRMIGVGYVGSDYSSSYCVSVYVYFDKIVDDEVVDGSSGTAGGCDGWVAAEAALPYVEGADYTVSAEVEADAMLKVFQRATASHLYEKFGHVYGS
jgi:hypothetical protein